MCLPYLKFSDPPHSFVWPQSSILHKIDPTDAKCGISIIKVCDVCAWTLEIPQDDSYTSSCMDYMRSDILMKLKSFPSNWF